MKTSPKTGKKSFRIRGISLLALFFTLFALSLTACLKKPGQETDQVQTETTDSVPKGRNMADYIKNPPKFEYVPGTKLKPAEELVAWFQRETLQEDGYRMPVKIPVVVELQDNPFTPAKGVFIGVEQDQPEKERVRLYIDDTFKGIPFSDDVNLYCKGEASDHCLLYLTGTWEPGVLQLPIEEFQEKGKARKYPFSLSSVEEYADSLPKTNDEVMIYFVKKLNETTE